MTGQSRLRKIVFLTSLLPILVIVFILLIALRLEHAVANAQFWVTHTLTVEGEIETISNELLSAQSGLRAYVLTQNPSELAIYTESTGALPGKLRKLQTLVSDSAAQSARSRNLAELAARRLKLLKQAEELAPRGIDPPQLISKGRALMRQIRAESASMLSMERGLLAERQSGLERIRETFTLWLWTALAALISSGTLAYCYVHFHVIRRLEDLTKDVQRYGRSNEPVPLINRIRDEIGVLRQAFRDAGDTLSAERELILATVDQLNLQTRLAQEADHAKGDFLACMSHEIRTPMTSVVGLIEFLLGRGDLPQYHRSVLEKVRDSSQILLSLINDILDFSKIEAGKLQLDVVPCDLLDLAHSATEAFRPQAEDKGISLELHVSSDAPRQALADPVRVRQILTNLISNAVKFTERGFIRVEARNSPQSGGASGIELSVHDSGIGIARSFRERLFQPFSQADLSTTREFGGTGLGLSIIKRLVEMMDGKISVESELGMGSRFIVMLPLQFAESVEASTTGERYSIREDGTRLASQSPSVLLAEDNPTNQLLVKLILEAAGMKVTVVANGEEAVAAAQASRFDVILMDCRMPRVDGYEATRRIRALSGAAARTPIVALTANAFQNDEERCRNRGMDDFLAKPFEAAALVEKCRRWCEAGEKANKGIGPASEAGSDRDAQAPTVYLSREIVDELRGAFLTECPKQFAELIGAIDQQDQGRIRDTAHWLRGACGFFAPELAERLQVIETESSANRFHPAIDATEALTELFESACLAMRGRAQTAG